MDCPDFTLHRSIGSQDGAVVADQLVVVDLLSGRTYLLWADLPTAEKEASGPDWSASSGA